MEGFCRLSLRFYLLSEDHSFFIIGVMTALVKLRFQHTENLKKEWLKQKAARKIAMLLGIDSSIHSSYGELLNIQLLMSFSILILNVIY